MKHNLIDYCDHIRSKQIPGFSKFEINFDFERQLRSSLIKKYKQEKIKCDEAFDRKCELMYYPAFQQVVKFTENVFGTQSLFKDNYRIQATSFIMGEHISDHHKILEKLTTELSSHRRTLTIKRLGCRITRRADLQAELEKVKKSKQLLIIIDQAIEMDMPILNMLVVRLHSMIEQGIKIAVLFCVSKECNTIYRQLKPEIRWNNINFHPVIVNTIENLKIYPSYNIQLVENSYFAPTAQLLEFLADDFIYRDPTITNLKYVYQYCLFRLFDYTITMFTLQKQDMLKLMKSNSEKVGTLKKFKTLESFQGDNLWKSRERVANFCTEKLNHLKTNHNSLLIQISYYYELLKDGHNFPTCPMDIYGKLVIANNLAESEPFIEAIYSLKKYSREGIMRRLDEAIALDYQVNDKNDIKLRDIFVTYKSKFENNQDGKEVVTKLIDVLISHAQLLKDPFRLPLAELFYFNDVKTVKSRLTSYRKTKYSIPSEDEILSLPVGYDYYHKILFKLVMNSAHEISEADLYDEFRQDVENYGKLKKESVSHTMPTPSKRARKQANNTDKENSKKPHDQDEGFIKALYVDLIDDLEFIGVIKQKLTRTRKGFLDRRFWHVFSESNNQITR